MLLIKPISGEIVDANVAACKFYGYSIEELKSKTIFDINAQEKEATIMAMQKAYSSEKTLFTFKHQCFNRVCDVEVQATPIRMHGQELILSVVNDISPRLQHVKEIRESKEYLESIFRAAPVGIGMSKKRVIKMANQRFCEITGYSTEELVGNSTKILYPSKKHFEYAVKKKYQQIAKADIATFETRWKKKDGTIIDVLLSFTPIDLNDVSAGVTFAALDISKRKQVEQRLFESEEATRTTLNSIGDAVIATDHDGRIVRINPTAEQLTGWLHKDVIGQKLTDVFVIINPKTRKKIENQITNIIEKGEKANLTDHTILIAKDGTEHHTANSVSPIRDDNGDIKGVVLVFRDITQKHHMQQQLKDSENLFQKMLNSIPDLVSVHNKNKEIEYSNWHGIFHVPENKRKIGIKCYEAYRNQNYVCEDCYANTVIESKQPFEKEIQIPDGRYANLRVVPLLNEHGECNRFVEWVQDITKKKQIESALKAHNQNLLSVFDNVNGIAIQGYDENLKISYWNQASEILYGYKSEEAIGKNLHDLIVPIASREAINSSIKHWMSENVSIPPGELILKKKDGTPVYVYSSHAILTTHDGSKIIYCIDIDLSDLKQMEIEKDNLQDQLIQSQKMESIGRLAGGIAHDFNNMLGAIMGYAELELSEIDSKHPIYSGLQEILKAAVRSAGLTKQLLAFARKQAITPKITDLNKCIENMLKMLQRLIGENIELIWLPHEDPCIVMMDPSQIDQILANLSVNAQDAMDKNGKLIIKTKQISFKKEFKLTDSCIQAGEYIMLEVKDNGRGIEQSIINQIFEPFFTTKEKGVGTGLGLATVYGIVKQNKGYINVRSEIGKGTVFEIYLPCYKNKEEKPKKVSQPITNYLKKNKTILLVEDEPSILNMIKNMLEKLGYNVLSAQNPKDAVMLTKKHVKEIDLLLTDVVMPNMNGKELADKIKAIDCRIKIMFMSGYTQNIIDENALFIQKPFSMKLLDNRLKEAMTQHTNTSL